MRQDHTHLNIVRFNDYAVVEFDAPVAAAALLLPRPAPVVSVYPDDAGVVTLVPAPTEGAGRYAFCFVPGDFLGHCQVNIAIADPDDDDRDFTREVHFIIIPDSEAVINVGAVVIAPKTPEMLAAFVPQPAPGQQPATLPNIDPVARPADAPADAPNGTGTDSGAGGEPPVGEPPHGPAGDQPQPDPAAHQDAQAQVNADADAGQPQI